MIGCMAHGTSAPCLAAWRMATRCVGRHSRPLDFPTRFPVCHVYALGFEPDPPRPTATTGRLPRCPHAKQPWKSPRRKAIAVNSRLAIRHEGEPDRLLPLPAAAALPPARRLSHAQPHRLPAGLPRGRHGRRTRRRSRPERAHDPPRRQGSPAGWRSGLRRGARPARPDRPDRPRPTAAGGRPADLRSQLAASRRGSRRQSRDRSPLPQGRAAAAARLGPGRARARDARGGAAAPPSPHASCWTPPPRSAAAPSMSSAAWPPASAAAAPKRPASSPSRPCSTAACSPPCRPCCRSACCAPPTASAPCGATTAAPPSCCCWPSCCWPACPTPSACATRPPGEWGRLLGLDRCPAPDVLRRKIAAPRRPARDRAHVAPRPRQPLVLRRPAGPRRAVLRRPCQGLHRPAQPGQALRVAPAAQPAGRGRVLGQRPGRGAATRPAAGGRSGPATSVVGRPAAGTGATGAAAAAHRGPSAGAAADAGLRPRGLESGDVPGATGARRGLRGHGSRARQAVRWPEAEFSPTDIPLRTPLGVETGRGQLAERPLDLLDGDLPARGDPLLDR